MFEALIGDIGLDSVYHRIYLNSFGIFLTYPSTVVTNNRLLETIHVKINVKLTYTRSALLFLIIFLCDQFFDLKQEKRGS